MYECNFFICEHCSRHKSIENKLYTDRSLTIEKQTDQIRLYAWACTWHLSFCCPFLPSRHISGILNRSLQFLNYDFVTSIGIVLAMCLRFLLFQVYFWGIFNDGEKSFGLGCISSADIWGSIWILFFKPICYGYIMSWGEIICVR